MSVRETANKLFTLLGEPPLEPLRPVDGHAAQLSDAYLEQLDRDIAVIEAREKEKTK